MKTLLLFVSTFICLGTLNAQNAKEKNLGEFNSIKVDDASHITIIQSDSDLVAINSGGDLHLTSAKVRNGMLLIHSTGNVDCIVKVKNLTEIIAKDASVVKSGNTLTSPSLKITTSDASTVNLNIASKSVEAIVKDASTLKLSGTTDNLTITASDAAAVKAYDLKASDVNAAAHDGASVKTWADKKLDAQASETGAINYKGSPAEKNTSTSERGVIKNDKGETVSSGNTPEDTTASADDSTPSGFTHKFSDAFVGFGYVLGPDNAGSRIKYGKSREFNFGFGGGYKFFKWNGIGADIYYKGTGFYLNQDSTKVIPNNVIHSSEKVAFNNLGGLVFDRFFIGKMFFDGGFYYEWTFHTRHVTWDNHSGSSDFSSSTKTIDRQLAFANPSSYGLTFRLGSQRGFCFYFNYRMTDLFKQAAGSIAAPPELPPYVLGINIGGF